MAELFSAVFFKEIVVGGIVALLIPIVYRLWMFRKKSLISITWFVLIGLSFVVVWLLVGIASSIPILLFPYANSRDNLIIAIWQVVWVIVGVFFSTSSRATLGAVLGAIWGLFSVLTTTSVLGFGFGFLLQLIMGHSSNLGEQFIGAFAVGLFGAVFLSFCFLLLVCPFTTLGGAILGFLADVFGKMKLYEKLLQKFRINPDNF